MKKTYSDGRNTNPPTNYNSSTKQTKSLLHTQSIPNIPQQSVFNASFFDISNNFLYESRVNGLQKSQVQTLYKRNKTVNKLKTTRQSLDNNINIIPNQTMKEVTLPKIKIKTKNGYINVPINDDYLFKPSKNFVHETVKLKDRVYSIIDEIKSNESYNKINDYNNTTNRLNDFETLVNTNNKEYFNLIWKEKENNILNNYEYGLYDNKKANFRSQSLSLITDEIKNKVEEKLEDLDNNRHKSVIVKEEDIKIKLDKSDAKLFQDLYLQSSEKFSTINNKLTYPNTFKDSKAINYLFKCNIEKMKWENGS